MAKITKKISEFVGLRETRNSRNDSDFMVTITMNLLRNLGDRSNFIHKELNSYRKSSRTIDNNLKIATGLYVCSLITCWETFFRDLFIFLCNYDEGIKHRLLDAITEEIPLDLTIGEFTARKYNFQNLKQTKDAFDYILGNETERLSDYFTSDVFDGVLQSGYSFIFRWIQEGVFQEKVNNILERGFEIRHRVTHDANFLLDFDSTLLSEIECVFQMIPQFFVASFAAKYAQKRVVFNLLEHYVRITDEPTKDEKFYAFNVRDFMADDYEIVGT